AQRRNPRPMCTMLIDIDHFKNINDRHGHPVGDRMIQHVATLIRGGLRASDVACRWGGEEFLVLLPDCSAEHAATIGEKLRHRIANTPLALDWDTLSVTVSVGMTVHRSGDTADQIFERTDRALYIAKNGGRDQLAQA
ncbi:MAG: GGDEF domain-containing protein, partial [Burkholderiales bacterium]|nr:GGDEF domain-containing protein [Burkholderiales bacterium]